MHFALITYVSGVERDINTAVWHINTAAMSEVLVRRGGLNI